MCRGLIREVESKKRSEASCSLSSHIDVGASLWQLTIRPQNRFEPLLTCEMEILLIVADTSIGTQRSGRLIIVS